MRPERAERSVERSWSGEREWGRSSGARRGGRRAGTERVNRYTLERREDNQLDPFLSHALFLCDNNVQHSVSYLLPYCCLQIKQNC